MTGIRLAVLDLDGTVFRGSQALPHAGEAVARLLASGIAVRFFTNNSAARADEVAERLAGLGVACDPGWVYGTGRLAAEWLWAKGLDRATVVGEPGLVATLAEAGIATVEDGPAVLVGICRSFSYRRLALAADLVRSGADFVATNRDATFPLEGGRLEPGAGAMVAAVEVASGRAPLVLGKPSPIGLQRILAETGVSPAETLVVGDRMDTDVACGRAAGCRTFLVLTGATATLPPGQAGGATLADLPWP